MILAGCIVPAPCARAVQVAPQGIRPESTIGENFTTGLMASAPTETMIEETALPTVPETPVGTPVPVFPCIHEPAPHEDGRTPMPITWLPLPVGLHCQYPDEDHLLLYPRGERQPDDRGGGDTRRQIPHGRRELLHDRYPEGREVLHLHDPPRELVLASEGRGLLQRAEFLRYPRHDRLLYP